jgi:glyceraldehyde 3-phosphate dehydrogenase
MSNNLSKDTYSNELNVYVNQERAAVDLAHMVGKLLFDKSVELVLFRNHLLDTRITEILRLHRYAAEVVGKPISIFDSAELANALYNMDLAPAKIDIGKLASEWAQSREHYQSQTDFLNDKLANFLNDKSPVSEPRDVVLFGFGRIGRLAARELVRQAGAGQQLRLRAIVTREDDDLSIKKRAALFENDSVHGRFKGTVSPDFENKCLIVNGQRVHMIAAKDPGAVDYTAYGIQDALLIDNTGVFKDRAALSVHLKSKGISKVILTAPGKEVPNIVYGINHRDLDIENETIFSAASCTTNAICPILKTIHDNFGIDKGHIETVHAYTNDQNLLDNMHKKSRRGRAAAVNMVITETGAGKAVTKVIPTLENKLTSNAVRVPTPNGSLAIIHAYVNQGVTIEQVNAAVRKAALEGDLVNQIFYSISEELVSSDIVGNDCCSVFDSPATIVSNDGKGIVLYVWYDNEFGYTKQVIRLAKYVAKVRRSLYY